MPSSRWQNLMLHAQLFNGPRPMKERVQKCWSALICTGDAEACSALPLGIRQRLSLAVHMVHRPELLIPTSRPGVDPGGAGTFWQLLAELSRRDQVTIFISTRFMNEAERCDRMSMMHAGRCSTATRRLP